MDKVWPSCIVAAPGPSLRAFDYSGLNVIAVNDAYQLFPNADTLYAADMDWWTHRKPKFNGERLTCTFDRPANRSQLAKDAGIELVPAKNGHGFTLEGPIHYGRHSGFQAINIAMRRTRLIVMVGFDMKGTHFFGAHKRPLRQKTDYQRWIDDMHEAARHLPKHHRIINATEDTALECFERMPLAEALNEARQARQTHND